MHIHYADEKTETSTATPTEAILPPTTERTTTALYDEHESSKSHNWKIGMSVSVVLVVLFTAIGKSLRSAATDRSNTPAMNNWYKEFSEFAYFTEMFLAAGC